MTILFGEVQIGGKFEFRGRRYRKVAKSMAHDEERWGNIFRDETEVVPWERCAVEGKLKATGG